MSFDEVARRWIDERPKYEAFAHDLESKLLGIARLGGIQASVSARAKDAHSFGAKMFRKNYSDPWLQITDKAGARVIVPTYTDVDRFVELVKANPSLEIAGEIDDKRNYFKNLAEGDVGILKYSGVHFQLCSVRDGEPLECEVQVRTIAQDAWSVVSHKLVYKPSVTIPREDAHAILRLVALVEIFDQEVKRVAERVERLDGVTQNKLLEVAESLLAEITPINSDRKLSMMVLDEMDNAIPDDDAYFDVVRDYAGSHRADLASVLATYGPYAGITRTFDWMMLGQAELLILMERLNSDPHAFQLAWAESALPNVWLEKVADVLGLSTPLL